MNTEIFDYIKELSKKEFFFVNLIDSILGIVIIISSIVSLKTGASILIYTIMFACATLLLGLNSYKCFKRHSKNGWIFAVLSVIFLFVTALCITSLVIG